MAGQRIAELYGRPLGAVGVDWTSTVGTAECPYLGRRCLKSRKSEPEVTIGTCSIEHASVESPVMICPFRLLQGRRIFADALPLMESHEPGNQLHAVPEFSVPGSSIDYLLVSVNGERAVDFVGIELQTLDTTGTVWPARERFLSSTGVVDSPLSSGPSDARGPQRPHGRPASSGRKRFGLNWKMTAKTSLVQLHHKLGTFEHLQRRLLLVLQDHLLDYMRREFRFDHLSSPASPEDPLQLHAYRLHREGVDYELRLAERVGTDGAGLAEALDLRAEAKVDLAAFLSSIQSRLSDQTRVPVL